MHESLESTLTRVGQQVLYHWFAIERPAAANDASSTVWYRRFVEDVARSEAIRVEWPVLARLFDLVTDQFVVAIGEVIERFDADRERLAVRAGVDLGPIDGIMPGLGDRHDHGRTVIGVRPAGGPRLAYKPRSVAGEALAAEVGNALSHQLGLTPPPWALDCETYGWMEWVEHAPVRDAPSYWWSAGVTAALLHYVGAYDLHLGNVIAAGDRPVAVDLECFNLPGFAEDSPGGRWAADSVLQTGLFPTWFNQDGWLAVESAGLFPDVGAPDGNYGREWRFVGTDAMTVVDVPLLSERQPSEPTGVDGRRIEVDVHNVVEGFRAGAEALAATGTGDDHAGRWLLRSTATYTGVIDRALAPAAMGDERAHAAALSTLPSLRESYLDKCGDRADAVQDAEVAALARLDVPRHWAKGGNLHVDSGPTIEGFFAKAGRAAREERLARWRAGGIRVDVASVRLAVEQSRQLPSPPPPAPIASPPATSSADAVDAAIAIAESLWAEALHNVEGPTWLEVDAAEAGDFVRCYTHCTDLYLGSDGVACLFAAVAARTGDAAWEARARQALWAVQPHDQRDVWAPSGLAGWIYARLVTGRLLADEAMIRDAAAEVPRLLAEATTGDPLDLFGGLAGLVAVATTAAQFAPTAIDPAVELATLAAEAVEALQPGTVAHRRASLLSAAHGTVGISGALLRASKLLEIDRVRPTVERILDHEEERVAARGGLGAKLVGPERAPVQGWCWGAAGYVNARCDPSFDGEPWRNRSHVEASAAAASDLSRPDRHLMCCGLAGRLIAMTSLATHDESHRPASAAMAGDLVARFRRGDRYRSIVGSTVEGDSLFGGRAGCAYALLHHASPETVPNPLRLA